MINDLVKRLRADELPGDRQVQREARTTLWSERHEAADCIEKLQAANLQQSIITVDHLSRIEKLEAGEIEFDRIIGEYASENARFRDRIEKLEAALREIVERAEHRMGHAVSDDVCVIARKALEGKDD